MRYKEFVILNSNRKRLCTFWHAENGEVECVSSSDVDRVFTALIYGDITIEETGEYTDDRDEEDYLKVS